MDAMFLKMSLKMLLSCASGFRNNSTM